MEDSDHRPAAATRSRWSCVLDTFADTSLAELARITVPTLVLTGAEDGHNDTAEALANALGNGRYVMLPGNHGTAIGTPQFEDRDHGLPEGRPARGLNQCLGPGPATVPAQAREPQRNERTGRCVEPNLRVRLRAGDPDSFGVLFDQYAHAVYNLGFRLIGEWSAAEEVVRSPSLKPGA